MSAMDQSTSGGVAGCTCNIMWHGVIPPPPCPYHSWYQPHQPCAPATFTFTSPPRLSDEDVRRIADEVVRRLRSDT